MRSGVAFLFILYFYIFFLFWKVSMWVINDDLFILYLSCIFFMELNLIDFLCGIFVNLCIYIFAEFDILITV